eukprot:7379928-Prymnesium_polylepis.1
MCTANEGSGAARRCLDMYAVSAVDGIASRPSAVAARQKLTGASWRTLLRDFGTRVPSALLPSVATFAMHRVEGR